MPHEKNTTWIEVNLAAIQRNFMRLREITQKPVMPVVKGNAYGHGLVEVSRALVDAGAMRLCVARIEEALRLREAGVETPVLVLGYTTPECVNDAILNNVSLMVNSLELAKEFNQAAAGTNKKLKIHVKVDSGMHRLGLLPDQIEPFTKGVIALPHLQVEGIFTHFPNADDLKDPSTMQHLSNFAEAVKLMKTLGIQAEVVHAANSAAALYFPEARFDAVRPGIALYGLHPDIGAPLPAQFEPALTWKGRIASIKYIPAGEGVGYNYRYRTTGNERIGVASVGYADGLRRRLGNLALVNGRRVHQVGGMCMDQSLWQLDDVPGARVGDEVVFVGRQGEEQIGAEEVGLLWGSNNYDVVCGLAARVPRFYYFD